MSKNYSIEKLIQHPKWKWNEGMMCIIKNDNHTRYSDLKSDQVVVGVSLSDIPTQGCLFNLLTKEIGYLTVCFDSNISPSYIICYWKNDVYKVFYGISLGDSVCQALADFWEIEEK